MSDAQVGTAKKTPYLEDTIRQLKDRADRLEEQAARVEATAIRLLGPVPEPERGGKASEIPESYLGQINETIDRLVFALNRLDDANSRLEEAL